MAREKAATIIVFLDDGPPERHELASDKDWSLIFEDVLEIKGRDATTYYPLDAVRKWCVQAHGGPGLAAAPYPPGLQRAGQETKARS